ncbi:MAG: dihydroorotate dehydrogenase electron transfer subunit [Calditrichaeota bacterium]|nr:dihydroorotate dehydrogenase electron transfer subunit [Calditrichota bacterium]
MILLREQLMITARRDITPGIFSLRFRDAEMAAQSHPGQFLMIRTSPHPYPLWRRAFSIARVYPETSELEILILKVGKGSQQLGMLGPGDSVNVLGPLGTPFDVESARNRQAILVGGGIGIAPLLFLADRLLPIAQSVHILFGARTAGQLIPMGQLEPYTEIITEDGSAGKTGRVTDFLRPLLLHSTDHPVIYACGPNPMLKQVQFLAETHGIPCQLSLETYMACGMGVCMGCPVPARTPDRPYYYACVDGPVFHADQIQFEE